MRTYRKFCDRCDKEIIFGLWDDVCDYLEDKYPGKDICSDCDLTATLAESLISQDFLEGNKLGTSLKKLRQFYE